MNNTDKKLRAELILSQGLLRLTLRTDAPYVVIPGHLRHKLEISLMWGTRPYVVTPIPDLSVTSQGISGTLSFAGLNSWCYVPWSSVVSIEGADTRWSQSSPKPLASGVGQDPSRKSRTKYDPKVHTHLRAVK